MINLSTITHFDDLSNLYLALKWSDNQNILFSIYSFLLQKWQYLLHFQMNGALSVRSLQVELHPHEIHPILGVFQMAATWGTGTDKTGNNFPP